MIVKSKKTCGLGTKLTAFTVAFVFTVTSVFWTTPAVAAPTGAAASAVFPMDTFAIPSEMGSISKTYFGERGTGNEEREAGSDSRSPLAVSRDDRTVILIQDAHAVVDAQENIAKILGYLQKSYGVRLTALEGAKGRLEPILLKTFPEPSIKRKIFAGYEKRAELTGPEMAAILQDEASEFRGMEDWGLYEKNYSAYLNAQQKKGSLLSQWSTFKQLLDRERAQAYAPSLNEFEEIRENFVSERASLLDLLLYFSKFQNLLKTASGYQELPGLIASIGYEQSGRPEALVPLVRKIADEFKVKYLRGLGVKAEMNFYNRYQAFNTGQITAGQMLQYLVQLGSEHGKVVELTPELKKLLGHTEILSEIKGSRLYDEIESFLTEVESSLTKTPAERELAGKYKKLFLLKEMITLELTHEDLAKYQKEPDAYLSLVGDPAFKQDLGPVLEFYQAALERDQAFMEKIAAMMKATKQKAVAVVAGGFHTRGLERILKEKGVAYVVVTPKIASLAGAENYAKIMKGDVSFKDYLKTTYFDALMRHAAKALVEALPIQDRVRTLKAWRDNVIRELAKDGRIAEAGKYLPYIDEILQSMPEAVASISPKRTKEEILDIVRKELEKFKKDSFERIWKTFGFQLDIFTNGLKQLVSKNELSISTVSALLDRASQTKPSFLGPILSLDSTITNMDVAKPPALPVVEVAAPSVTTEAGRSEVRESAMVEKTAQQTPQVDREVKTWLNQFQRDLLKVVADLGLQGSGSRGLPESVLYPNSEGPYQMLLDGVPIKPGDRIWEVGTGSGVITYLLAKFTQNIPSVSFWATDIDLPAVKIASEMLKPFKNVKVLQGDLSEPLHGEKVNTAIWNPPWFYDQGWGKTYGPNMVDPGFKTILRFLKEAGDYLEPNGKIYLLFPVEHFEKLKTEMSKAGIRYSFELKKSNTKKEGLEIGLFEYDPMAARRAGFSETPKLKKGVFPVERRSEITEKEGPRGSSIRSRAFEKRVLKVKVAEALYGLDAVIGWTARSEVRQNKISLKTKVKRWVIGILAGLLVSAASIYFLVKHIEGLPSEPVYEISGFNVSGGEPIGAPFKSLNVVAEGTMGVFHESFRSTPLQGGQCVFVLAFNNKNQSPNGEAGPVGGAHFFPFPKKEPITAEELDRQLESAYQYFTTNGFSPETSTIVIVQNGSQSMVEGFGEMIENYFKAKFPKGVKTYSVGNPYGIDVVADKEKGKWVVAGEEDAIDGGTLFQFEESKEGFKETESPSRSELREKVQMGLLGDLSLFSRLPSTFRREAVKIWNRIPVVMVSLYRWAGSVREEGASTQEAGAATRSHGVRSEARVADVSWTTVTSEEEMEGLAKQYAGAVTEGESSRTAATMEMSMLGQMEFPNLGAYFSKMREEGVSLSFSPDLKRANILIIGPSRDPHQIEGFLEAYPGIGSIHYVDIQKVILETLQTALVQYAGDKKVKTPLRGYLGSILDERLVEAVREEVEKVLKEKLPSGKGSIDLVLDSYVFVDGPGGWWSPGQLVQVGKVIEGLLKENGMQASFYVHPFPETGYPQGSGMKKIKTPDITGRKGAEKMSGDFVFYHREPGPSRIQSKRSEVRGKISPEELATEETRISEWVGKMETENFWFGCELGQSGKNSVLPSDEAKQRIIGALGWALYKTEFRPPDEAMFRAIIAAMNEILWAAGMKANGQSNFIEVSAEAEKLYQRLKEIPGQDRAAVMAEISKFQAEHALPKGEPQPLEDGFKAEAQKIIRDWDSLPDQAKLEIEGARYVDLGHPEIQARLKISGIAMITQEPERVFTRYTDEEFFREASARYEMKNAGGFELRNMVTLEKDQVKIVFVKQKKNGTGYEVQDFLLDTTDLGLLRNSLMEGHGYSAEFADNIVAKARQAYEQVRLSHDDDAPSNFRISAYIPKGQQDMAVEITSVDLGEVGRKGKPRSEIRYQIPESSIPKEAVVTQDSQDRRVLEVKLMKNTPEGMDRVAAAIEDLEHMAFLRERSEFAQLKEVLRPQALRNWKKALTDSNQVDSDQFVYVSIDSQNEIIGVVNGLHPIGKADARLQKIFTKIAGQGNGYLLLDAFLSRAYLYGADQISWNSLLSAAEFYDGYIASREEVGFLKLLSKGEYVADSGIEYKIQLIADPINGMFRSEVRAEKLPAVRIGGLVVADPAEMVKIATAEGDIEKVHAGLQEQGRSELRRMQEMYEQGAKVFLEGLKQGDVAALVATSEGEGLLVKSFREVPFIDVPRLYGAILSAVLMPAAFADEVKFVDAEKVLDHDKIKAQAAVLGELIANAKSPRIAILMNRPAQNQDAEQVLKMIGKLPIEQLIVLYQRGQPLGSKWRAAAQGRFTPVAVKGNDAVPSMAQKIVKSRDGQLMVSFWTQNFGAGDLGIYSVLAEINRIADPDLKSLALSAVHYAILRFASLDEKTRRSIIADPAKIKEYLDQSITALSFFKFGKSGLELVIDQFVNNYLAEKSIQAAA